MERVSDNPGISEADAVHRRILNITSGGKRNYEDGDYDLVEEEKQEKEEMNGYVINPDHEFSEAHNVGGESQSSQTQRVNTKDASGFDMAFLKRFYRLHGLLFLRAHSLATVLFLFLLFISLLCEFFSSVYLVYA